ncbi:hypothetical protein [Carboxylicivirga sp. RSCT41]|uniref:hypothetical protein n=1 Tax=Carboxylicivirga agarovorans TaxID=3417570 RepID=UPI003D33A014
MNQLHVGRCFVSIAFLLIGVQLSAEHISAKAGLISQDVKHGTALSRHNPVLQLEIEGHSQKFSAGLFTGYASNGEASQLDLYIRYQPMEAIILKLANEYRIGYQASRVFDFDASKTGQFINLEADVLLTRSIGFMADVYLWEYNTFNNTSINTYSTYLELNHTSFFGENTLKFFAGATPAPGYWARSAAFVSTGFQWTRDLSLNSYGLPVFAQMVLNPDSKQLFTIVGLSITK